MSRLGFWTASMTAAMGVAALATAVTTPPRSGPSCRGECVTYPYTDVAEFVPRDYLWMYPGTLLAILALVLAGCLWERIPPERGAYGRIAMALIAIAAAVLVVDYGIQLTVMQPALILGETEGMVLFSQYNPHGVFIALENVGYGVLGVAFLFAGAGLTGERSRPGRAVRWVFLIGGGLIAAALPLYALIHQAELDYRFEVVSLLVTWLVLIVNGILLAVVFARDRRTGADRRLER